MTTELFTKGYDSQNEDYCKVVELEGRTLVIMADGMGGLSLGAEAAECVCEGIAEYVSKNLEADNLWQEAFKYADNKLHELSLANHSNMGAAVTALIITETSCEVAWQGNVRLYLYRDNQLLQLTTDYVMNIGYGQKMLTRCLKGGGLRDDVPTKNIPLQTDDILFLCTDGFYNIHEQYLSSGNTSVPKEDITNDDATCLTIKIN
ncbi:protein phosphatase 2C domain-containing protein [Hoylesella timonensis]|uniref:PP2C family protein-serine/threonine phosphatase n=1 Tax=Hoylesella timonensis TaxID=386414 RepID=UPI00336A6EAE